MEPATEVLPSMRRFPSAELCSPTSVALYVGGDRKRFLDATFVVAPLRFDLTCGERLDSEPPNDDVTDQLPLRCPLGFCLSLCKMRREAAARQRL